jgi:hypothetical protein
MGFEPAKVQVIPLSYKKLNLLLENLLNSSKNTIKFWPILKNNSTGGVLDNTDEIPQWLNYFEKHGISHKQLSHDFPNQSSKKSFIFQNQGEK